MSKLLSNKIIFFFFGFQFKLLIGFVKFCGIKVHWIGLVWIKDFERIKSENRQELSKD